MSDRYELRDRFERAAIVVLVLVVGGLCAVLLLRPEHHDVYSAPANVPSTPSAVGQPSTPSAASQPSRTPSASLTLQVRQTRHGANSDTTLLQVREVPASPDHAPTQGNEWVGVRAKTCMHPNVHPSGRLRWSAWSITDSDGTQFKGAGPDWDDYPAQQYVSDGIEPGACVLGWVLIEVPSGPLARFQDVVFLRGSVNQQSWGR